MSERQWTGDEWDGAPTHTQAIDYLCRIVEGCWSANILPITTADAHAVRVVKHWLEEEKRLNAETYSYTPGIDRKMWPLPGGSVTRR